MNNISETDQWLLTGECNKCRKQSYCRKPCTAVKREFKKGLEQAVMTALADRIKEKESTDADSD